MAIPSTLPPDMQLYTENEKLKTAFYFPEAVKKVL